MAKFKVGDRVRGICRGRAHFGQIGTMLTYNKVRWDDGIDNYPGVDALELANLKLEKGATVRLKDGVDEWVVDFTLGSSDWIQGIRAGGAIISVKSECVVVVKEKPEDPKPDYYVNCEGAEPQEGDVFSGGEGLAEILSGSRYRYLGSTPSVYDLRNALESHGIGTTYYPRTLLVRDGKPYTG